LDTNKAIPEMIMGNTAIANKITIKRQAQDGTELRVSLMIPELAVICAGFLFMDSASQ